MYSFQGTRPATSYLHFGAPSELITNFYSKIDPSKAASAEANYFLFKKEQLLSASLEITNVRIMQYAYLGNKAGAEYDRLIVKQEDQKPSKKRSTEQLTHLFLTGRTNYAGIPF